VQVRKPTMFRNALDLRDKVQVRVLRRRLKLSDPELNSIVRKTGTYRDYQGSCRHPVAISGSHGVRDIRLPV
jgi:hypothetical protein